MFAVPENTIASPARTELAHPALIATAFARDRERWAHLLRYDPDERFSALVSSTAQFEVWLLSWLPGQSAQAHDHGAASGAFTVVSGALTERVLRDGADLSHSVLIGQTRVFGPGYVHQVSNTGIDPAVSIHVYRPQRVTRPVPR